MRGEVFNLKCSSSLIHLAWADSFALPNPALSPTRQTLAASIDERLFLKILCYKFQNMNQHILHIWTLTKKLNRPTTIFLSIGGAILTITGLWQLFSPNKDEFDKEKLAAVQSLHDDLLDSKIYFAAFLKDRTRLTSNWIKNDYGIYETRRYSSNLFYLPTYFFPDRLSSKLLNPNKWFAIPDISDKGKIKTTDSFLVDGKMKYVVNGISPVLPDSTPIKVYYGNCLVCEPNIVDYSILRHADNPYLPDSIRESLLFFKNFTYSPISFSNGISNCPDSLENPFHILFSVNNSFITDTLSNRKMVFSIKLKDNTDRTVTLTEFYDALYKLNGRIWHFLTQHNVRVAIE